MTGRSPRNVIVVNKEWAPLDARYDSPSLGPRYRPRAALQLRSGVSLCVFIEREGEGS
jgi:hypothetical protein